MRVRTGLLFALAAVSIAPSGMVQASAQTSTTAPTTISFCESPDPNAFNVKNCATLTWNGQGYDAKFSGVTNGSTNGPSSTATITYARDQDGVTLNRTDTAGTVGVTAGYSGEIAADNTISGTVVWSNNGTQFASGKWQGTVTMPVTAVAPSTSGSYLSSIPLSIAIDEPGTAIQTPTGLHRIGKLMWDGQRYMGAFIVQRSDGTPISQASMGYFMLKRTGNDFSLTPVGPTGQILGDPEYTGAMNSSSHGAGTVLKTDQAGTIKGTFSAEFKFTDETPAGPSNVNSDFSAITITEIITTPDKLAGAQRTGKLARAGGSYTATFGPLIGLDGKPIGLDSGGTVTVSRVGSNLTMEGKDTTGTIGSTEYKGGVNNDQKGAGKFLWKTEKAGDLEGIFTIVFSNDAPQK